MSTQAHKRIDTHAHIVLPALREAIEKAGGDPGGWITPEWSEDLALEAMEKYDVSMQVLSVSCPGPAITGTGQEGRDLARRLNEEIKEIVQRSPTRFRYFATLPDWRDVEGTVAEINRVFESNEERHCVGVIAMTSYGSELLGSSMFKPIWETMNEHAVRLFIHPTSLCDDSYPTIAGWLPQPVVDFPLATTRTAVDIVFNHIFQQFPRVEIILSHAGGALPLISQRSIGLLNEPRLSEKAGLTVEEAEMSFRRFYVDVALSTSPAHMAALPHFVSKSHILYGTDFPYPPERTIKRNKADFEEFLHIQESVASDKGEESGWEGVSSDNARALLDIDTI